MARAVLAESAANDDVFIHLGPRGLFLFFFRRLAFSFRGFGFGRATWLCRSLARSAVDTAGDICPGLRRAGIGIS